MQEDWFDPRGSPRSPMEKVWHPPDLPRLENPMDRKAVELWYGSPEVRRLGDWARAALTHATAGLHLRYAMLNTMRKPDSKGCTLCDAISRPFRRQWTGRRKLIACCLRPEPEIWLQRREITLPSDKRSLSGLSANFYIVYLIYDYERT